MTDTRRSLKERPLSPALSRREREILHRDASLSCYVISDIIPRCGDKLSSPVDQLGITRTLGRIRNV